MVAGLLSPIFIAIAGLTAGGILLALEWRKLGSRGRVGACLFWSGTLLLWLASSPAVAVKLAGSLEAPYVAERSSDPGPLEVVVILGGGYFKGLNPNLDDLVGSTYSRVVRGVRTYKQTGARLMVMSGFTEDAAPDRMVSMMKALAVEMGIPPANIITECRSRNTFEHPLELSRLGRVDPEETIGLVTSAWHLPRAMAAFRRLYPKVVGIPADSYMASSPGGALAWVPQSDALSVTTTVFREKIGSVWYVFRGLGAKRGR